MNRLWAITLGIITIELEEGIRTPSGQLDLTWAGSCCSLATNHTADESSVTLLHTVGNNLRVCCCAQWPKGFT